MVAMDTSTDNRGQIRYALLGGTVGAISTLIRYAGIGVGGAMVLWALLPPGRRNQRVRRAAAALLPQLVLTTAWIAHVRLTSGGVQAIRAVGAYGGIAETLRMGAATVVEWLVPLSADQTLPARGWLALLLLAAIAGVTLCGLRHATHPLARVTIAAAALLGGCYSAVLLGSRLLADPDIPFDERLLLPLFVLATIVAAIATRQWWSGVRPRWRAASVVVLLAWLTASGSASFDEAASAVETGEDLAQDQWRSSPLITWARDSAGGRQLFSNWAPVIVFHLARAAHELPSVEDDATLRAFADTVRARKGVVLAFDEANPGQIGPRAIERVAGLRRVARFQDGAVFVPAP
jgi:hypothetical protein